MTEGKLEDEWRWRMLAALFSGTPVILFDNLREKLDSSTVSAIVTRPDTYSGRLVGSGKNVTVPVRVLWLLTANNMKFSHDNARRSILIRLDANLENPEEGRTYRHKPCCPGSSRTGDCSCGQRWSWFRRGSPPVGPRARS